MSFHRARGISSSVSGLESIDANVWTDDEFRFSIRWIEEMTGLSNNAIRSAHAALRQRGLLNVDAPHGGYLCLTPSLPSSTGDLGDPLYVATPTVRQ